MPPVVVYESVGATEILVRNAARMTRLVDLRPELDEGAKIVYEHTRRWFDSEGEGSWPALSEFTVTRKASQGYAEPERILYAEGNLYESVTSDAGPYSFRTHSGNHDVVIGADWDEGGWQIPVVLSEGTTNAGASGDVVIPPRPIWPTTGSLADLEIRVQVGAVLFGAVR